MNKLKINTSPEFEEVFMKYPEEVRKKLMFLRSLITEVAEEVAEISDMVETLKWGEPSFLVKKGSTIRIDWKDKTSDQYAMYFKCTSKLVPAFKTVFGNTFHFEGSRAIIFEMDDKLPERELKRCIKAALTYHHVKELPNLGL